ncbi:TetR/AcrR family transcriptional regulator [Paracoccus nototheniae]|uniref:TetR/AcrR family transcriptional regulator n=1 Tax=Paracoccus nototheniae TaxID=2489002 RepID=A0ABW4DU37_9RHOB|nr:TetR/AcrR family transcriptional regulator [Paracoccus nototheniae]
MSRREAGRRESRRLERRETIIQTAQEQFLQNGFSGTSMSQIAERLGGSKATLWTYFSSKEDLFRHVVNAASMELQRELTLGLKENDILEDALLRFCRQLIESVVSARALALRRVVAAEAVRFPEVAQIFFRNAPARLHSLLATILETHMRNGNLRSADALEAAQVLTSICHGNCFRSVAFGLSKNVEAHEIRADARLAVDVFLRAYGCPGRMSGRLSAKE